MELTASQEDYLKNIYIECSKNGYAKITSIASSMNVKKPSVNTALNILLSKNLVNYKPYSYVTLTEQGTKIAQNILNRYEVMISFFSDILRLNHSEALENSCKIEHVMSEELFNKITNFYKFTKELYNKDKTYRAKLDEFLKNISNQD